MERRATSALLQCSIFATLRRLLTRSRSGVANHSSALHAPRRGALLSTNCPRTVHHGMQLNALCGRVRRGSPQLFGSDHRGTTGRTAPIGFVIMRWRVRSSHPAPEPHSPGHRPGGCRCVRRPQRASARRSRLAGTRGRTLVQRRIDRHDHLGVHRRVRAVGALRQRSIRSLLRRERLTPRRRVASLHAGQRVAAVSPLGEATVSDFTCGA